MPELLEYEMGGGVRAFTAGRDTGLPFAVTQPHQTHSTNVAYVDRVGLTREDLEGVDALVTNLTDIAIGVRTADCIPVLLYDPVHRAVGAAHSGWRGTVNMISKKTVLEMCRLFRTRPEDIIAVIGPGIGYDSFQVGEEVALTFKESGFPIDKVWSFRGARKEGSMEGGHHIDLKECIRFSLTECGVPQRNITVSDIDTYTDKNFYSARREGNSCGRNINAIMLI
ncbi:MAG: peptidoglycan editing factor PgeF [Candidatus Cryptobacteroides sp.]